ncbi:MAG TPA: type II secretion system F family protein [Tepidisphaeraceae bacterium]|nr:type II secretion system F family protein [Tepidisphaeraceae bacterium]
MDQLIFIFVVALAVGALVWGATMFAFRLNAPEKRRLQQRLGADMASSSAGPVSRPLMLLEQSTGLPAFTNKWPVVQKMQIWLGQASPNGKLSRFLASELLFGTMPCGMAWLITSNPVIATIAGIGGALVPYMLISSRRSKRRKQFCSQLPEALDFLSRVLRSGQSLSTGLQMIGEELPQPLSGEFRRCYDQHSLGQSIEDALRGMAQRLGSTDFSFFATAVIIQRQSGGDLAEVLRNISDMVRKRLRLSQSVKAKTAEGRLTGYVMVTFPVIMFAITYMIDPVRGDVLLKTSTGHILLMVAAGLEIFGLFLIKRITTINV